MGQIGPRDQREALDLKARPFAEQLLFCRVRGWSVVNVVEHRPTQVVPRGDELGGGQEFDQVLRAGKVGLERLDLDPIDGCLGTRGVAKLPGRDEELHIRLFALVAGRLGRHRVALSIPFADQRPITEQVE